MASGKESACNLGDLGSMSWEDPLEKETGNPLQYSCLDKPIDRGEWWAIVHGISGLQQLNTQHYN